MIEINGQGHIIRLYAYDVQLADLVKPVIYFGYRGDMSKVPRWYKVKRGSTAFSDLTQDWEEIVAAMKSNTRNEIRRAQREGCEFAIMDSLDEFISYYNDFCRSKGFADLTSRGRMSKYKHLLLTKVVHNGQALAMHANVLDPENKVAFLLYSCSRRLSAEVDRKLIGWGNRLLHYCDLRYLKDHGFKLYDWSGVDPNPQSDTYAIGQFKLSFGGKLAASWILISPIYRMAACVRRLIRG